MLDVDPASDVAYVGRGHAREGGGDRVGALADFDTAIRLRDSAEGRFMRGNARKASGDLDGAIADYGEAIRRTCSSARTSNNRGNARQAMGDLDGAIADYTAALKLEPEQLLLDILGSGPSGQGRRRRRRSPTTRRGCASRSC